MDDFAILGLGSGATEQEVKAARKKLVRSHHPDLAKDPAAAGRNLADINAAFDRIMKGQPRAARQEPPRRDQRSYPRWTPPPFEEVFRKAWNQTQEQGTRKQSAQSERSQAPGESERASAAPGETKPHPNIRKARQVNSSMSQKEDMREALEERMKKEIYRGVTQSRGGIYPNPRSRLNSCNLDLPEAHMAEALVVEGGVLHAHFRKAAKAGRNIVAIPNLKSLGSQADGIEQAVHLFEVAFDEAGKQVVTPCGSRDSTEKSAAANIRMHFGSSLVRELRQNSAGLNRDAER